MDKAQGRNFPSVDLFGVLEVERPRAIAQELRSREFWNPYWVEAVVIFVVIWTWVKGGASCGARLKSEFGVSYILGVGFISRQHSRSLDLWKVPLGMAWGHNVMAVWRWRLVPGAYLCKWGFRGGRMGCLIWCSSKDSKELIQLSVENKPCLRRGRGFLLQIYYYLRCEYLATLCDN